MSTETDKLTNFSTKEIFTQAESNALLTKKKTIAEYVFADIDEILFDNKDENREQLFNDKKLKIKWPIKNPIISNKDKKNMTYHQYLNKKK